MQMVAEIRSISLHWISSPVMAILSAIGYKLADNLTFETHNYIYYPSLTTFDFFVNAGIYICAYILFLLAYGIAKSIAKSKSRKALKIGKKLVKNIEWSGIISITLLLNFELLLYAAIDIRYAVK